MKRYSEKNEALVGAGPSDRGQCRRLLAAVHGRHFMYAGGDREYDAARPAEAKATIY
jgi:hypothetical protein